MLAAAARSLLATTGCWRDRCTCSVVVVAFVAFVVIVDVAIAFFPLCYILT